MSHTPGPWTVEVQSDGWDGRTTAIYGAHHTLVLCGWGYDASGLQWGQDTEAENQATVPDARLIAAAPDLVAALKAICHDGAVHWDSEIKMQTLAAIAKAEGT